MSLAGDFRQLYETAKESNTIVDFTETARSWAENRLREFSQRSVKFKIGDLKDRALPGRVYQFAYEAKHKDTLPYYDKFPFVVVIRRYKDGFLGLNLHYLSFYQRAILFDKLLLLARHPNIEPDQASRFILGYDRLRGSRKYRFHGPTLKRYLYSQMLSPLYFIPGNFWSMCLFLPTTEFVTKNRLIRSKRVHRDSRLRINRGK